MAARTIFLSRLLGLYALVISISMLIHKAAMITTAAELAEAPPLLFIAGMFTLLAGLAMVLAHNVWSGGALPVVVTLIGSSLLIRGIVMVFISPSGATSVYEAMRFPELYYVYVAIPLALGSYLTYGGFKRRHS
jgi:hypothetical protein